MQRQLEQCQRTNDTGLLPPLIIKTSSKGDVSWSQRRKGPLSDGTKGVIKTKKHYKNRDITCWSHDYDCSKKHHSGNCTHKKNGHINSHTGDNPAAGASQKDKQFLKWF